MTDEKDLPPAPETPAEEAKPEQFPICPHCNAEPVSPNFRPFNIGPIRAVAFYCTNCRKLLPVFLLPSAPPQPPRIVPPSRIMKPA